LVYHCHCFINKHIIATVRISHASAGTDVDHPQSKNHVNNRQGITAKLQQAFLPIIYDDLQHVLEPT